MDHRPIFSLTSTWSIPAAIDVVWFSLVDTEKWSQWWPYVISVRELSAGNPDGIGNIREYLWRTRLPYQLSLTLQVTEVQPYRFVAVDVSGELQGYGDCRLTWEQNSHMTKVIFTWNVVLCKDWLNSFTIVAKPIFIWNHTQVMKRGESGLIKYLADNNQRLNLPAP